MRETIIYYYLVKKIDYIRQSKDYKDLYMCVINYLPELTNELKEDIINRILLLKIRSRSIWLNNLKIFCQNCDAKLSI